jgi:hypothetical protein
VPVKVDEEEDDDDDEEISDYPSLCHKCRGLPRGSPEYMALFKKIHPGDVPSLTLDEMRKIVWHDYLFLNHFAENQQVAKISPLGCKLFIGQHSRDVNASTPLDLYQEAMLGTQSRPFVIFHSNGQVISEGDPNANSTSLIVLPFDDYVASKTSNLAGELAKKTFLWNMYVAARNICSI